MTRKTYNLYLDEVVIQILKTRQGFNLSNFVNNFLAVEANKPERMVEDKTPDVNQLSLINSELTGRLAETAAELNKCRKIIEKIERQKKPELLDENGNPITREDIW